MLLVITFATLAPRLAAQTLLSIDFNERGQDPVTSTQPGFDPFLIETETTATAAVTLPSTRTFGPYTVTLSPAGGAPNYDDRYRSTVEDGGDFTEALLLRDFVFSGSSANDTGLDFLVGGLTPAATYQFTFWSYDRGSTGNRVSDWHANGIPVVTDYVFNGSIVPTNNNQQQFTFKAPASAIGEVFIAGRRDAATASAGSVFVNALQVEVSTPDAPPAPFSIEPLAPAVSEGRTVTFTAVDVDPRPVLLQWQRDDGLGGFTNIPSALGLQYTTAPLTISGDDGGQVRCVASNLFGAAVSAPATLTVFVDTNAPTVVSIESGYPYTHLVVTYSEPVNAGTATELFNYYLEVAGPVNWTSLTMLDDARVLLQFEETLAVGQTYTLMVIDIQDLAPLPNVLVETSVVFTVTTALNIDFNERGQDPLTTTMPLFQPFMVESETSATANVTNPTTRLFGPVSVTLSGNGPNPNYDDRLRSLPADAGEFNQSLLLRDFVFNNSSALGAGLNVAVEGLTAGETYRFTLWSYDNLTTGDRFSDWYAQGGLVVDNYGFNGSNRPTNNAQYSMTFKATASPAGSVLIEGRRVTANLAVFLNALELAVTTPEPPALSLDPAPVEVYAGGNAIFRAAAEGTVPLTYVWQKDGADFAAGPEPAVVLTNVGADAMGLYSVRVTNAAGAAVSEAAQLTVRPVDNLQTALVSYWPLDTATDTTPDATGRGNDLFLADLGAIDLVAGLRENAFSFNGTNGFLLRHQTNSTGLPVSLSPAYTIALWVKGDFTGQNDRRVFSESSDVNNNPLVTIGTDPTGATNLADIYIRTDENSVLVNHLRSQAPVFDDTWHHLAWVDDHGFATLYVDGSADTNIVYTRGSVTPSLTTVGAILRAEASHWFLGLIDEVAVWSRGLSPAEVQLVFTAGPLPGGPEIARIEISGDNVVLTIVSDDPGAVHQIEETATLAPSSWAPVPAAIFSLPVGNTFTATLAVSPGTQRFFRVTRE